MATPPVIDPVEQQILQKLGRVAQGEAIDPFSPRPSNAEMMQAQSNYIGMKKAAEARATRAEDFELLTDKQKHDQHVEEERLRLEFAKAEAAAKLESEKINLEYARLEIQKADVIVRALEAAAKNPEMAQLLGVVKEMSARLLGGAALPSLQIEEDKK